MPPARAKVAALIFVAVSVVCIVAIWIGVEKQYGFLGPSDYSVLAINWVSHPEELRKVASRLTPDQKCRIVSRVSAYADRPRRLSISQDGYVAFLVLQIGAFGSPDAAESMAGLLNEVYADEWQRGNHRPLRTTMAALWATYRIQGEKASENLLRWVHLRSRGGDREREVDIQFALILLRRLCLRWYAAHDGRQVSPLQEAEYYVAEMAARPRRQRWTEAMVDMGYTVDTLDKDERLAEAIRFLEWVYANYGPNDSYEPINGKWDLSGCVTATAEMLAEEFNRKDVISGAHLMDSPRWSKPSVLPVDPVPWRAQLQ